MSAAGDCSVSSWRLQCQQLETAVSAAGDCGVRKRRLPGTDPGVGARAGAHRWGGVSPFKMRYSVAFKHYFISGGPPLG